MVDSAITPAARRTITRLLLRTLCPLSPRQALSLRDSAGLLYSTPAKGTSSAVQPQEQRRSQAAEHPAGDGRPALGPGHQPLRQPGRAHAPPAGPLRPGHGLRAQLLQRPLCAPSRASMLTGLLSSRLPVNDNAEELPATAVTFVHYLRRAGYRTVLSGKMHYVGPDQLHGFEERLTTDIYPADFLWTKTWDSQGDPPRRVGLPGDARRGPATCARWPRWSRRPAPSPGATSTTTTKRRTTGPWGSCARWPGAGARRSPGRGSSASPTPTPTTPTSTCPGTGTATRGGRSRPPGPPADWRPHPIDVWTNAYHGVDAVAPTAEDVARARQGYYASTSYFDDKLGRCWASLSAWAWARIRWSWSPPTTGTCAASGDVVQAHRAGVGGAGAPDRAGPGSRRGSGWGVVSLVDLFPTVLDLAGLAPRESSRTPWTGTAWCPSCAPSGSRVAGRGDRGEPGRGHHQPHPGPGAGRHKLIYTHGQPDQLHDLRAGPWSGRTWPGRPALLLTPALARASSPPPGRLGPGAGRPGGAPEPAPAGLPQGGPLHRALRPLGLSASGPGRRGVRPPGLEPAVGPRPGRLRACRGVRPGRAPAPGSGAAPAACRAGSGVGLGVALQALQLVGVDRPQEARREEAGEESFQPPGLHHGVEAHPGLLPLRAHRVHGEGGLEPAPALDQHPPRLGLTDLGGDRAPAPPEGHREADHRPRAGAPHDGEVGELARRKPSGRWCSR